MRVMKRNMLALALLAALAGCASNVKLDDVAVEDKAGKVVSPAGPAAGGGATAQSGVAPVTLGKEGTDAASPAGPNLVYFDYDSFVIKPEFGPVIDAHARYLNASQSRRAVIEGHTDERGGREYNLALGQKRAEAVRRALTLVGASDAQVEAVSFGEEKPAVAGSSEDAYAKNRRVEIRYR